MLLIRQRETWRSLAPLAEPPAYMGLLALLVLAWGLAAGGIDQPERVSASRFSHDLPPDNILPLAFANALRTGHVASPFFGDWLSSDRPPLQVGFCLLLGLPTGHRAQS